MKHILAFLLFTLTLFANIPTSNTYDALNRLKTVTDSQGTTTYDYDAIGRQTKVTFSNGLTTEYSYDSRNRITNITHKKSDGTVLQSFAYTLDAVGNRTQIVEHSGRTVDYEYNSVNQLTKEVVSNDPNGNNTTTTFTYDAAGNLITKTIDGISESYSYNENDQLTTKGSVTYAYDANGNLVDDGTNSYEYDDKNRLVKVTTPTDSIEYSYDANDNRIAKTTNNGTTTYLIDANTPFAQVVTESRENGTEIHYTYGNDLLSDGTHSFLTDALGSTRGLVDESEVLTDSYAYTPYGELVNHDGSSENSFLFTGEQLDEETQDYYLRARYYSPSSSRFLSRDTYDGTMNSPVTQNHYLYAGSNPSMFVDPSGHFFSMAGLTNSISIMGTLGRIRSGISLFARRGGARSLKYWNVYLYTTTSFGLLKGKSLIHSYMYIGKRRGPVGFRYDVGAIGGWGAVFDAKFSPVPGMIVKRRTMNGITQDANRTPLQGLRVKITRFTAFQKLIWEAVVLRGGVSSCEIDYSIPSLNSNCISWTIWASAQARVIAKLPL